MQEQDFLSLSIISRNILELDKSTQWCTSNGFHHWNAGQWAAASREADANCLILEKNKYNLNRIKYLLSHKVTHFQFKSSGVTFDVQSCQKPPETVCFIVESFYPKMPKTKETTDSGNMVDLTFFFQEYTNRIDKQIKLNNTNQNT